MTRAGRAPGKQRINIGSEKLPTTGKAIRSLIPARYMGGSRCAPGSARRGARHVSNLLGSHWKGRSVGAWAVRTPFLAPRVGHGPKNQRQKPADSSGQGAVAGQGAHGEGEPLGLRVGLALVLRSLPSGWAPAGPWVRSCPPAGPIWAGRVPSMPGGPGSARWGHSLPFLSGTRALGQPPPACRGDSLRSSSSEGSVLSHGPWRDE